MRHPLGRWRSPRREAQGQEVTKDGRGFLAVQEVIRGLMTWSRGILLCLALLMTVPACPVLLMTVPVCLALLMTVPAWTRGPLLVSDSPPPPNIATLDIDGLRARATKGDAAAAADLGALYAHGWKLRRDPAE